MDHKKLLADPNFGYLVSHLISPETSRKTQYSNLINLFGGDNFDQNIKKEVYDDKIKLATSVLNSLLSVNGKGPQPRILRYYLGNEDLTSDGESYDITFDISISNVKLGSKIPKVIKDSLNNTNGKTNDNPKPSITIGIPVGNM